MTENKSEIRKFGIIHWQNNTRYDNNTKFEIIRILKNLHVLLDCLKLTPKYPTSILNPEPGGITFWSDLASGSAIARRCRRVVSRIDLY